MAMTNAQDVTYGSIKELLAGQDGAISPPTPLHSGDYASVIVEVRRGGGVMNYLIEAGGCLVRIYA